MSDASAASDRRFRAVNALLSAAVLALLFWLLVLRRPGEAGGGSLAFLPAVNASFNALAGVLLLFGFVAIRRGKRRVHMAFMLSAVASTSLFLAGYLTYHFIHGDTKYAGPAAVRPVYLFVLATHVLLSMVVLPLVFATLRYAALRRFDAHRRLARWLWPIWMYVSVTGVLVYGLLHRLR